MGKHKHSKVKGFSNILGDTEIDNSQNIGKVDFHSTEKHKHFKFMGFLNISAEAETHKIPKIWEM